MITLTLTEQELQALSGILDAAQRHLGLAGNRPIGMMLEKIEAAVAEANAKPVANGHDEARVN